MNRIGVVGGGQLARMLALAGKPLGLDFVFLDPAPDACASSLGVHLKGEYDAIRYFRRLANSVDVVTYEFENVPEASLQWLSRHVPVYPSPFALATARDRLREKKLFVELGIPTAPFAEVDSLGDLECAISQIGFPALLKTRTLGYDGKGQRLLHGPQDISVSWSELGGVPLILEGYIRYDREVSCVAVRGRDGQTAFYPLSENLHRDGMLRIAWSRPGDPLSGPMQAYTQRVLERLEYVGVLTIEYFQIGETLLANEMAPRVHNSGHWTIEGAQTSQFENHLRAILGWPLGATDPVGYTVMVNCIGDAPAPELILRIPGAHYHLYGKAFRPNRKVGHITLHAGTGEDIESRLAEILELVKPAHTERMSPRLAVKKSKAMNVPFING